MYVSEVTVQLWSITPKQPKIYVIWDIIHI